MKRSAFLGVLIGLLTVATAFAPASAAAPPSNDNFADATAVSGLPFAQTVSIVEATIETGEPVTWYGQSRSVWWSFTPADDVLARLRLALSCCPFLSVYRADSGGFGGLTRIFSNGPEPGTFFFDGGTTYYFQAGDEYPYGWTTAVTLEIEEVLPPPNDNFADAIAFSSVPYSNAPDMTAASLEPGEPMACGAGSSRSVWYAFTPTTSGSYGWFGASGVSVYTGASLGDLTNVACSDWPGLYFYGEAGTTYYLQATGSGVAIDIVPPPDPGWDFSPGDPSRFDEITFRHGFGYWDPTITEYLWDFGDGTSGTGNPAAHRFARDGNYTVTLTVNARGGRTASHTQAVQVRTHDVAVLWSSVPGRGRVGRAAPIEVGVGNTMYAETVQVDFYKDTSTGLQHLGFVTKAVPVMQAKKTILFSLSYTFTSDDLAAGKVSFKAVATILGARDAFTGDNTVTPPAVSVTR